MPRLVWSDNARRDIDRLYGFLEGKDKKAAKRAIRAIRLGLKVLEKQPEIGRTVDGSLSEYRERVFAFGKRAYVVLYYCNVKQVTIFGDAPRAGRQVLRWYFSAGL